jgi:hypothetical protein
MMISFRTATVLALVALSSIAVGATSTPSLLRSSQDGKEDEGLGAAPHLFQQWMSTHDKQYTTQHEQANKFIVWLENHGASGGWFCSRNVGVLFFLVPARMTW